MRKKTDENLIDPIQFSLEIETRRYESDDSISYFELVLEYLTDLDIPIDCVNLVLSDILKEKIEIECIEAGLIKDSNSKNSIFDIN